MKKDIITYQEYTTGEAPFDWNKMLAHAIKGELEDEELEDLNRRSNEWPLCACGNQCKRIPRWLNHGGEPMDFELRELGVGFMLSISNEDYQKAFDFLQKIEIRSDEILLKMDLE